MTWRSPGRLFQQAEPQQPLLLCFAGPRAAETAAVSTSAFPLLDERTSSGSSGGKDSYPTTVEVHMYRTRDVCT